ncbi:hypothetical protein AB0M61_05990 [Streptomyces sp. NPDC051642]
MNTMDGGRLHALSNRLLAHAGGPPADDLALVLCRPPGGDRAGAGLRSG